MNLLQNQAKDFISYSDEYESSYKEFVSDVRSELYEYRKDIYKLEFIEHIINRTKSDYDNHLKVCTAQKISECPKNIFYENTLFFLQEEIEDIESTLDPIEFKRIERDNLSTAINQILSDLKKIKTGQQITYDDLSEGLLELKDYYYLNKRNWTQLFLGKMTEMIAAGTISETVSKELVDIIKVNYPTLFSQGI